MPTEYEEQKKSWMIAKIFEQWLRGLDRTMELKGRKIALLVNNCPSHCRVPGLKAVQLFFLPPNSTAVVQPMDAGVIRSAIRNKKGDSFILLTSHVIVATATRLPINKHTEFARSLLIDKIYCKLPMYIDAACWLSSSKMQRYIMCNGFSFCLLSDCWLH